MKKQLAVGNWRLRGLSGNGETRGLLQFPIPDSRMLLAAAELTVGILELEAWNR
jgi:hypothetical protein